MSDSPEKGDPIARIIETQTNGKTREVGIQYRWDNGEITKMFTVAKKEITGSLTNLGISPEEIVQSRTAA